MEISTSKITCMREVHINFCSRGGAIWTGRELGVGIIIYLWMIRFSFMNYHVNSHHNNEHSKYPRILVRTRKILGHGCREFCTLRRLLYAPSHFLITTGSNPLFRLRFQGPDSVD